LLPYLQRSSLLHFSYKYCHFRRLKGTTLADNLELLKKKSNSKLSTGVCALLPSEMVVFIGEIERGGAYKDRRANAPPTQTIWPLWLHFHDLDLAMELDQGSRGLLILDSLLSPIGFSICSLNLVLSSLIFS